ncbi:30S ribosomal protein S6 [Rubripirellula amarantea]|uniref:Small ribosomal subunit protein bS6 n=1 Tax=Rubripirellula amarantea TaxID=2527999 RepID=A0A5C5WFX7_9BACT|nr:30S ribosomal protein S6 [Rubripirellula amarantea]TWT49437.1 30S ribosomal protein S6 [Rubripirellula amarantea]
MAKNTYETLLILDSNQYARDPGGVSKQVGDIITEAGGEVLVSRLWMEQKLAYPIDKHQKGHYWLVYFEMEGVDLPKIDRAFHLSEPVLRQLTLKLEPRLIEPILANARGESIRVSANTESLGADDEDDSDDDTDA